MNIAFQYEAASVQIVSISNELVVKQHYQRDLVYCKRKHRIRFWQFSLCVCFSFVIFWTDVDYLFCITDLKAPLLRVEFDRTSQHL